MDTRRAFTHPRHSAGACAPRAHVPRTNSLARTILIVGAGFSGTAVAIHRERPYLLNVPAGRMSASSVDPLEFLAYAQRRLPKATAEDFLPRELRPRYWQTTAVQELRTHAERLAYRLALPAQSIPSRCYGEAGSTARAIA